MYVNELSGFWDWFFPTPATTAAPRSPLTGGGGGGLPTVPKGAIFHFTAIFGHDDPRLVNRQTIYGVLRDNTYGRMGIWARGGNLFTVSVKTGKAFRAPQELANRIAARFIRAGYELERIGYELG